jgi:putative heme-binding domain-containing protein
VFLSVLAQTGKPADARKNPFAKDRTAIQAGAKLYAQGCTACHGASAQGGRGPKLADSNRIHERSDARIFDVLRHGVPGTDMIASSLPDLRLWQIVSFIRSLNAVAIDLGALGDAAAGEALFFGQAGCSKCHMISGQGGLIGPDLSDVGGRESLTKIRESIVSPNAYVNPDYAHVLALLSNGRVEGTVKNESNYSIQIQDFEGNFHSVEKSELLEITRYPDSLMPKIDLTEEQLQNLLAFLSRLGDDAGGSSRAGGRRRSSI